MHVIYSNLVCSSIVFFGSQNSAFFVRKSKTVSSKKPKQNLKRGRGKTAKSGWEKWASCVVK